MWCHLHLRLGHCALHHAQEILPRARTSLGAFIVERLVNWKRTLNPSWSDPSPYHNLRAVKVQTLRASLGDHGSASRRVPAPCHLGNCGMDNQGWHNAKCTFVCCIPDGHVHCMNAPFKRSKRHWESLSLVEAWWIPVDCTESGCNELHNIPMCILASQRYAQNTEG